MNRTFIAHSPLGELLEFRSLTGSEQISRLFEFKVTLLSPSATVSAKELLGKDMSVEIDLTSESAGAGKRYLSGQVTDFTLSGRDGDYYSYEAILRPWLWHTTRRSDFKIFQHKTVPQILKEVLEPYGFEMEDRLVGAYRNWEYMVQYGETDFNFISRLMEEEGAYYYFEHRLGGHKLILADDIGSHSEVPEGRSAVSFFSSRSLAGTASIFDEDYVDRWSFKENIASGQYAAKDYDFKKPKALLDAAQQRLAGHVEDHRQIYKWPGGYTELGDGENYARIRMEQQNVLREVASGEGNLRGIAPGFLLNLGQHPRSDQNQDYLIEKANYHFEENVRRSDGAVGNGKARRADVDTPTTYRTSFDVVPKTIPYRSQQITPKPKTSGPQTAIVTGPPGEEIYTDEYGRVKVQFNWDRYGQFDANSSVWIRVSQNSAGLSYGSMDIPRIGQEVIVDFLNGDPDYPIITGRVYNNSLMPPWGLPANKTQSGLRSRSSIGGAPGDGNVIRFEDLAGSEQLWTKAQKDQLSEVNNNMESRVGNDQTSLVGSIRTNMAGFADLENTGVLKMTNVGTVEMRNDGVMYNHNIGALMMTNVGMIRMDEVGKDWMRMIGRDRVSIISRNSGDIIKNDRSADISGNDAVVVGNDQNVQVQGNFMLTAGLTAVIEATACIKLICGASMIEITPACIMITSPLVKIN